MKNHQGYCNVLDVYKSMIETTYTKGNINNIKCVILKNVSVL